MQLERIVALLGSRLSSSPARASTDNSVPTIDITDLAYDSRRVSPGSLFFCIPGARTDGHLHAAEAVASGAVAAVCERPVPVEVPQVLVSDARAAMNRAAAPFFGHPSRQLTIVGITGTNGKTTTAYMLESIFRQAGWRTGLVGTVETRVAGKASPAVRTTPESADLQRLLRRMVDAGVSHCSMEMTSEGIDRGRIEGTEIDLGIFTNLTQDHLNYHGTIERYYEAKRSLFSPERMGRALINADDPWGMRLRSEIEVDVVTFGMAPQMQARADFRALRVRMDRGSSRFCIGGRGIDLEVEIFLPGSFNVANALAAAAAAHLLGVPHQAIVGGLTGLQGVPGRFEPVNEGQDFAVLVDYAHTPDSLGKVLTAAREFAEGRVIVVFGCGGDRDRAKRPLMGQVAGEAADVVFLTSDNPRSEDPLAIISDIEEGLRVTAPPLEYRIVPDRAEAIRLCIAEAAAGDVVVIAGKGHEAGQELAAGIVPFDDRLVAAEALRGRAAPSRDEAPAARRGP